jgi:hypothetical protein
MTEFQYERDPDPEFDDRRFLTIDERYTMSIVRTHEGIEIDVWPITEGDVWEWPCRTIKILDSDTSVDPDKRVPELNGLIAEDVPKVTPKA